MTLEIAPDKTAAGIDSQALASLIIELNISRRNSRSYPKGHQVIDAALHKVLKTYAGLRETGAEIVIGVACDALLLGDTPLDKSNLIYRDFARVLFERGIGALELHRGLSIEELRSFISILGARREDIYGAGGIESVWAKSGIASIGIRAIRYDLFSATEEARFGGAQTEAPPKGLWERFARGLVGGLLAPEGIEGDSLDPELLAEALNRQFSGLADPDSGAPLEIAAYLRSSDLLQATGAETLQADLAYPKLAAFAGRLTPGLRRQFLDTTFDIKKIKSESMAEGIIRQLSAEVVLETLEDINQNQISVPPFVLGLLQQMSKHTPAGAVQAASEVGDQELHEKMRTIFKEHAMEEFIPDSYQRKLHQMMSADRVPLLGLEGVHDLVDTLDAASMESRTSDILLLLLKSGGDSEEGYATLCKNFDDICTFFLQTGDYGQLLRILSQLALDNLPDQARLGLWEVFARREFLEELLDGLHVWGKVKFDEIAELIGTIGAPCTEALLDRLAATESMSLRRFLMDRLVQLGSAAAPGILERLSDERWFFLRNLIGVIRQSQLSSSVGKLRPLARHPDPRVCQEALRALLQFQDPEAESRIIRDLRGQNHELQLTAIRLAGKTGSAVLLANLHAILAGSGLSGKEYEVKSVAVQALGEIGNVMSLPVLAGVLSSRNLLHPVLSNRLKLEVVNSLGRYPAQASRPLLARIAEGRDTLARHAAQLLRSGSGRPS